MVWIKRTVVIHEWHVTIIAKGFYCQFDVGIYWIKMVEESIYLLSF